MTDTSDFAKNIFQYLSTERIHAYQRRLNNEENIDILATYAWNLSLCASLYPWLSAIEVALRNSFHSVLSEDRDNPFWFDELIINKPYAIKEILSAKNLLQQHKKPLEPGRIVAELNFGFWTGLFHADFEHKQVIWPRLIDKIFPELPRKLRDRKKLAKRASDIRKLRNRIFHYEPIWYWGDLYTKYIELQEMLSGISKNLCEYTRSISNFEDIFNNGKSNVLIQLRDAK